MVPGMLGEPTSHALPDGLRSGLLSTRMSARPKAPRVRAVLCALARAACDASDEAGDAGALLDAPPAIDAAGADDAGPPDCTALSAPERLGTIDDARLDELSGLAASRRHPGLFYAHNDSGDAARVFVIDGSARVVATISLTGASHRDYEDIAIGPGPDGQPWVFVGDVGDNAARDGSGAPRSEVIVYRFAEPETAPSGELALTPETTRLTYPEAPYDCESIFVDPAGDLFLLSKEDAGASTLYRAAAPSTDPIVLEPVATVMLAPGSASATAADLSPSGASLLVRTYGRLHLFTRATGEPWSDALARAPTRMPTQPELQSEAVAWLADGRGYVTAPEGASPPLARVEVIDARCRF